MWRAAALLPSNLQHTRRAMNFSLPPLSSPGQSAIPNFLKAFLPWNPAGKILEVDAYIPSRNQELMCRKADMTQTDHEVLD